MKLKKEDVETMLKSLGYGERVTLSVYSDYYENLHSDWLELTAKVEELEGKLNVGKEALEYYAQSQKEESGGSKLIGSGSSGGITGSAALDKMGK